MAELPEDDLRTKRILDEILVDIRYNIDLVPGVDPSKDVYKDSDEFLSELRIIRESLIHDRDYTSAEADIKGLMWMVETFGFHLMQLDCRQESTRHEDAVDELLWKLKFTENR